MPTRRMTISPPPVASFTSGETILRDQIALRAYELFLERGGEHGHDLEDWLRAEHEVLESASEVVSA